jgi:hypothetical protein
LSGQGIYVVVDDSFVEGIGLVRMVLEAVAAVESADSQYVAEL